MSLNKVLLIGRLGKDPERRFLPTSGEPVVNFSLATSTNWKDKTTGQKQEKTEWHNITIFGKLAEVAATYLKKGQQVYLEGRISSRKYTGSDNTERTAYDIICHEMVMLGSKNDSIASFDSPPNDITPSPQPNTIRNLNTPITRVIEEKQIDTGDLETDIPF